MIAFEHNEDIEETRAWLMDAVNHGSQEPFVYLYLVEIYNGRGKTCPKAIYEMAHSKNTHLYPEIIRKIRTMCGQSPSDPIMYKWKTG